MTYRVLESIVDVLLRLRRHDRLRGRDSSHLVPDGVVATALLVELDNIHDRLRILLLVALGNATLLEKLLPFLRETRELTRRRVEADMGEVHWVVRRANLGTLRSVQEVSNEAGKSAFLRFGRCGPTPPTTRPRKTRLRRTRHIGGNAVCELLLKRLHVEGILLLCGRLLVLLRERLLVVNVEHGVGRKAYRIG